MYLISTCIAANNRRDDDENMPGLHGNESLRTKAHIAHGTVISIAIVLFFPLGATMVPLFSTKNILWWHMVWQMTGMFILLVGFGLGCWLSYLTPVALESKPWDLWHCPRRPLLSTAFTWYAPPSLLHVDWKEELQHALHVWLGRILIALGIINGGMGIKLAANTTSGGIVYGVVAGVVFVVYVCAWYWSYRRMREREDAPEQYWVTRARFVRKGQ